MPRGGAAHGRDRRDATGSTPRTWSAARGRGRCSRGVDGIVVPGGFGYRGIEGKIAAARYAREHKVPYLGLCLGMQVMVIELARARAAARTSPTAPSSTLRHPYPVIDLHARAARDRRHGRHHAPGHLPLRARARARRPRAAYGTDAGATSATAIASSSTTSTATCSAQAGMVFSGLSPDGRLVEIAEIADHPWMVGSQFHPEFKSRPRGRTRCSGPLPWPPSSDRSRQAPPPRLPPHRRLRRCTAPGSARGRRGRGPSSAGRAARLPQARRRGPAPVPDTCSGTCRRPRME